MALVQTLPVPTDPSKSSLEVVQCRSASHSPAVPPAPPAPPPPLPLHLPLTATTTLGTMGSVSSLISSRGPSSHPERHCRTANAAVTEFGARCRKAAAGSASCFRAQDGTLRSASSTEQLLSNHQHNQYQQQQSKQHQNQLQEALSLKYSGKKSTTATDITNMANNVSAGNGNYGYVGDDLLVGDWNDNVVSVCSPCSDSEETREAHALNGNIGGPPPKLIPVSGQLEKSMEKVLIRPTAFKPVVPKNRNSVQYLSPRPGGSLSESQGSLNLLLPVAGIVSSSSSSSSGGGGSLLGGGASSMVGSASTSSSCSSSEKRNSYSGSVRHGGGGSSSGGGGGGGGGGSSRGSQAGTLSDSGRNSLSSLPPYSGSSSSAGFSLPHNEGSTSASALLDPSASSRLTANSNNGGMNGAVHGHSNSDSGRSSSSKSTGSLSGRGHAASSDGGSCGRSPAPPDGYEGVIRELEEKLREREQELQQLRDNLDENEAAICQVYEEKQKRCEQEMEDLRQNCATKMKQAQQKAQRAQQVLQLQVYQLQQEKKTLQEDFSHLLQEREHLEKRCASIEREQTQLGPRLEETKWEVCQKTGEISLLKQQLKDVQAELAQKASDLVSLRAQLREARSELQASQSRSQEAHAAARTRSLELEVCENELQRRKSEAELLRQKLGRVEEETARLRGALAASTNANANINANSLHLYSGTFHHYPHHHNNGGHHGSNNGALKAQQCMSLPLPHSRGASSAHSSPALLREAGGGSEDQLLAAYESDEAKAQRQQAQGQTQGQGHMQQAQSYGEPIQSLRQQVERLKAELLLERRRGEDQTEAFETERRIWQEEKDKVIRYQKQLQQNYIQMYRRNRELERVMRQLSLELESRDLEEFEVHNGIGSHTSSGEIPFEEITATEI